MNTGNGNITDTSNQNAHSESLIHDANAFSNIFLSLAKMRIDHDDVGDVDAASHEYDCNPPFPILSSLAKPTSSDLDTLFAIEENFQPANGIVDEEEENNEEKNNKNSQRNFAQGSDYVNIQSQQMLSSERPETVDSVSSLLDASAPSSCTQLVGQIANSLTSQPRSPLSDKVTSTQGTGALVYSSIVEPPMHGRALDFRTFLKRKPVPLEIGQETSAGVFVGQLPSTYTEEDTGALLCAIGADAGVDIHIRDVKSHNQSRTCAFVVINRGALQVLLSYSKRILCDVSCVWVVDSAQAPHLKDYVGNFVRERLRGVPKAALVLEELTAQSARRGAGAGKSGRPADAAPPVVRPQAMGVFLPQALPVGAAPPGAFIGGAPAPMYAVRPPAALPPYGYCVAPPVAVPYSVLAPQQPGKPAAPAVKASAGNAHGCTAQPATAPVQVQRPQAPELRCHCGSVMVAARLVEGTCTMCKNAMVSGDTAYACPAGHTVVCMRCFGINFGQGEASSTFDVEKNVGFVQTVNYTGVPQVSHNTGLTLSAQSFSGCTQGIPYMFIG